MKKIGMVVAAAVVVSYAGAARAQTTTEQIITATATIESVMSLEASDADFDCGLVSGFGTVSANCEVGTPGGADAVVSVTANQNWVLTSEDLVQVGSECEDLSITAAVATDIVTLCNQDTGATGDFQIALDYSSSCAEATVGTGGDTVNGTSAEDCSITVIEETTGAAISGLDSHDGFGVYTGSFQITLSSDS